jgi:sporulation protein YlmC with PRC-barrel domain
MTDLGAPTSYLALATGVPVLTSDGREIGTVAHVLAMPEEDIFDGLVIQTDRGPRFADAVVVDQIHERGVTLRIDAAQAARLDEPTENPPELSTGPDDTVPDDTNVSAKLRRAWDLISGKY